MSDKQWFYYANDQAIGPYHEAQIQDMLKDGLLSLDTYVWDGTAVEHGGKWIKLNETSIPDDPTGADVVDRDAADLPASQVALVSAFTAIGCVSHIGIVLRLAGPFIFAGGFNIKAAIYAALSIVTAFSVYCATTPIDNPPPRWQRTLWQALAGACCLSAMLLDAPRQFLYCLWSNILIALSPSLNVIANLICMICIIWYLVA